VFTYFSVLLFFVFLTVSLFIEDLVRVKVGGAYFFNPAYWEGVTIVPWVLLAYVFTGAYTIFVVGVHLEKKTEFLPLVTGAGALVNVAANFLLIPRFGILGAAYATLAAYVVMAGGMYCVSQRFFRIEYEWGKIARLVGAALLVGAIGFQADFEPLSVVGFIGKVLLILLFSALVFLLRVVTRQELSQTKSLLAK
jgi:O-antigen/teichoic acid export membrane protein